ncbi:DUF2867 domain-containing protein [Paludisphaera rhizosphaerae]|uniref:DUF2867 domain-containing protein n=1 Tax=Paludisphaera rhizosphaerae TaxID=2711216 RepID=UPI0013EDF23A|nr:DUF2867 domain-containing protein [Paludisphaera rhizosphaerae]
MTTTEDPSTTRREETRSRRFDPSAIPLKDVHRIPCSAPSKILFDCVRRLGGETGWHGTDALWRFRGAIDRLLGGVGMRKGRRSPVDLRLGDPVDFWRVERTGPGRLLLRAEMRNPGTAWLEFLVYPDGDRSELRLAVYFRPIPFWGQLYYFASYPAHWLVFQRMARGIVRAAERRWGRGTTG